MESQHSSEEQNEKLAQNSEQVAYPPPPSYYQNMQAPTELPPLPGKPAQPVQPQPYFPQQGMQPTPFYAPGQYPGAMPPTGRPRKQALIIVAIICASVLLLCGAGSWALATMFGTVAQEVNGATQVVDDFYQHVQTQNYSAAFQDLQFAGLDLPTFQADAASVDTNYGLVTSFSIDANSLGGANGNLSHWQIAVVVTRQNSTYTVQIPVDNTNGSWKITSLDLSKF